MIRPSTFYRARFRGALGVGALILPLFAGAAEQGAPLRVYGNTQTLELAPVLLAAQRLGPGAVVVSNGGIPNLFNAGEAEVATNAETQALRVSVEHPDLRVVLTVAEGYYRIVARKSSGISKLSDLRGKKIATVANTSSAYHLHRMLATVGLSESDVTVVSMYPLTKLPAALRAGEVDAATVWEPEIQKGLDLLGAGAIEFQNRAVYRELFNLNTTAANLADPAKRKQIVAFVAEVIRASADLRAGSREAFPLLVKATGFDQALIEKAWPHEAFYGDLVHDLTDVMAAEDVWLAQGAGIPGGKTRAPRSRADLVTLVDPNVRLEALELLKQADVRAATSASTSQDPEKRLEALSVAVDNVEAIRAVKRLQYAYARYLEQGRWADVVALFSDSATVQIGDESLSGRAAIRKHFVENVGRGKSALAADRLNLRLSLSPVVNLSTDGARAKARWHEVAMLGERGKSASWEGGIYENEYVRENGVWKIAVLHYYPQYTGTYEAGWRSISQTPFVVPYHYDARGAGIPIPDEARKAAPSSRQTLASLQQRMRVLSDEAEVQNLQHAYGYYADRKMWDDVADLFVDKSIRGWLGTAGLKAGELNDQLQLETIVTVSPDGRTARTQAIQLGMIAADGVGQWSQGVVEGEYVKDGGVWKIRSMRISPRFTADYAQGWMNSELRRFPKITFAHPVTQAGSTRAARAFSGSRDDITARISELERQVAIAEARDGAENVSNAYGYYIDEFKWVDAGDLFAREGWKELSYIGTYIGRDHVRDSMTLRYGSRGRTGKQMTLHQKIQPVVHVSPDGQSAHIRTRLFQLNSVTDAPGSYIGGIYENEIVKEDGVWKIAGMDLDYTWTTSYVKGWARASSEDGRAFAPRPDASPPPLAPDRPLRGVAYAPFPDIVDVPFHYRNPVTGRAPPVLLLP
jgi:ABC-type nitrate/sulfonate/bicarbonate transport system substrate-binding protein